MAVLLMLSSIISLCPSFATSVTYCHRGSYYIPLGHTHACELCGPGTFMPFHDHQFTKCFDCMKIEDDTLEILIRQCNRTDDSVIYCVKGYYRRRPMNPREKERCETCTECPYPTLPCRTYEDTHCCQGENFEVAPDRNGMPGCVERPWLCRRGEYFDTGGFHCVPCSSDTCMPLDYHSMTECNKCHGSSRENLPKHAIIIQSCNKTHQAVIGCKDEFYFSHTMGHYNKDIGCSPCKTCSSDEGLYEGRECGRAHDTVCCPQPNMTVVDTPGSPECRLSSEISLPTLIKPTSEKVVCAENEYLYKDDDVNNDDDDNNNKRPLTCRLCPYGTFMDETNHTKSACKNCRDFEEIFRPSSCPSAQTDQKHDDKEQSMSGLAGFFVGTFVAGPLIALVVFFFTARWYPSPIKKFLSLNSSRSDDRGPESEGLLSRVSVTQGHSDVNFSSDGPQERNQRCKNMSKHDQYITMEEFNAEHLPACWVFLVDYIKAVADITVRLSVSHMSKTWSGSGIILNMTWMSKKGGRSCPCKKCKNSDETVKQEWGQAEIFTAHHVVSDESRHTMCDIEFNTDESEESCPKLEGVGVRASIAEQDYTILYCVTHSKNVTTCVKQNLNRFRKLKYQDNETENDEGTDEDVKDATEPKAVMISHPHGKSKRISVGNLIRREGVAPHKFVYDTQACEGSDGAPVCILGDSDLASDTIAIHSGPNINGENQSGGCVLW